MRENEDVVMHTVCPWCLREHDLVGELTRDGTPVPYEGALSLCIKCGKFAVFKEDLTLRRPTREEQREYDTDPHLAQVQLAWMQAQGYGR